MTDNPMRERPRLYLITPAHFTLETFKDALKAAFEGGDIACVQLRMKETGNDQVLAAAKALMPIAHAHDAAFLINDRADLAAQAGADGVHLGQEDGDLAEARKILGHDKDIGVTCHNSRHLAFEAGEAGADYVAFGAFFPSQTKIAKTTADLETIQIWADISEIPCVAIGGITAENCAPLVKAGADFLAVSDAIWSHENGPKAAVSAFNAAIDAAFSSKDASPA
ncbi:thiamine-phosphate synthase [Iodidimonas gelatinilytica]|uniref:Thiamine-phosphate synthase n=1 Tax=Iodidimonas gelatinilytica TaxID=1236966 RepID=A0A5A7MRS2_9PROT|nr:thiamine phosphate synthase [Iodidimonas gelatinilytica]GEQ98647.1 thiamine-phosphate synthase [Iodidimonas gelatinilytica]